MPNRTSNSLPATTGTGAGSTVGPFMIYPMRAPGAPPHRGATTLGDYLDAIYRRKWMILALVLTVLIGTWRLSLLMPKMYEATATLDVDRLTPNRVVGPEGITQIAPDMDQFVATHVRMLTSDAVLRPVALKYGLREDESRPAKKDAQRGPIRLHSLKVVRPPNTYLIQITYTHRNPETAAAAANAIAAGYIEHLRELREGGWSGISSASHQQLAELRTRTEESNRTLLDLQRRIGMVDPDDKTNVWSARLLQLNTDYARAQAELASKQAAYDTIRSGVPEAAEASVHGELLKKLMERRAEAAQKFSDVKTLYGENHPEYKRLSAQLREVDDQLKTQYGKAVQRAESELRETKLRASNLKVAYEKSKAEADQVSAHALEYRLLKQRAEADRALYDDLSRKVSEADINSGLRVSPVKIADSARADYKPAWPNVPLNCAVALIVSVVLGCVGAVMLETRRSRIRNADDLKSLCGAQVVAALPSVPKWRGKRGLAMFSTQAQKLQRGDVAMARFREEIRMLRNGFSQPVGPSVTRMLAVISPENGEGRSRVAVELASAFSAAGKRTLLIDANLRSPILHTLFFSTGPRTGLSSALDGSAGWRESVMQAVEPDAPDLLPSGAPDARTCDLLHQKFFDLLDDAESQYDCIVVDSPPFLRYSESLDIVRGVDAVVAVARAGVTDPRQFETMLDYVQRVDARVAAIVLNDVAR